MRKLLIILMLLIGCTNYEQLAKERDAMMNGWINHSKGELILSWGPPTRTYTDPSIGEALIWSKQVSFPQYNSPPALLWDHKIFYVKNGIIYAWKNTCDKQEPAQLDVRIYRN